MNEITIKQLIASAYAEKERINQNKYVKIGDSTLVDSKACESISACLDSLIEHYKTLLA